MKPKSISGIVFLVGSLELTRDFYSSLGFRIGKQSEDTITAYVNWFWIEFREDKSMSVITSSQSSLAISVEDIETFYQNVLEHGYHPESAPRHTDTRREFTLRDPNGHLLTFFQK